MVLLVSTTISIVLYPINEKDNTSPLFKLSRIYFPSKSVEVPRVVPFIITLTPGISDFVDLSVTFPLTVCWAKILTGSNKRTINILKCFM